MVAFPFDTYRAVTMLKDRGFSEDQAAAMTEAIQAVDMSEVATKTDLRELELRMTIKLGTLIVMGTGFLAFLKFFG